MATASNKPCLNTWPSEARNVLSKEIKILRETANGSADPETLVVLDLLEANQDHSALALELALTLSARFAAAAGLSQPQWIQQLLGRHANRLRGLETLWQALVALNLNGSLPWPTP